MQAPVQVTLRQLEAFLSVARAGSFRRGAEALHLSQPALSQHVGELERSMGARLLDRRARRVTLTEAGRIMQEHALRVLGTLASAREAIADLGDLDQGPLVVGASTTPGLYLLPAALGAFERRYPRSAVTVRIGNSVAIEEQVRANELDLGVVGGHGLQPGEECLAAGVLDEIVLIMPPGHGWARRSAVAPGALHQERLLVREEGSATRQVTEQALHRAGVATGRSLEFGHTEAIKQAVMAGLGVAFVSAYAVRGELETGRLRAVRVKGLRIQRHFHVIHNEARALGARARAFIEVFEGQAARTRAGPPGRARRSRRST